MTSGTRTRTVGGIGWNIWRGVVGVAYLAAAAFNLFYTLPKGDLGAFLTADAWFPFVKDFVNGVVVPHNELIMVLVVLFEIAVGVLILARGRCVDVGVWASVLWVVFLMPFLRPSPHATVNVGLAIVQGVLVLRRYDTPIWGLFRTRQE